MTKYIVVYKFKDSSDILISGYYGGKASFSCGGIHCVGKTYKHKKMAEEIVAILLKKKDVEFAYIQEIKGTIESGKE